MKIRKRKSKTSRPKKPEHRPIWNAAPEPLHLTDASWFMNTEVFIAAKIMEYKPKSIIDVGCGNGKVRDFVRNTIKHSLPWHGLDYRDLSKDWTGKNCKFDICDFTDTPSLPESIRAKRGTMVICCEVIEHLQKEDGVRLLKTMADRMSRGVYLLLTLPVPQDADMTKDYRSFQHVYYPSAEAVVTTLEKESMEIREQWNGLWLGHPFPWNASMENLTDTYGVGASALANDIRKRYTQIVAKRILAPFVSSLKQGHLALVAVKR